MRASVPYRQSTRRPAPRPAPAPTDQGTKQQVPSTHKGVRVGGQPKRGARATAQQSSLSSTARCQVTAVGVSTSIFVHARSCKGVLHVFDTSPAPRVGTGCARPLMLTFSIIRMDTTHASPFICSLLKTTYVALSRNNLPSYSTLVLSVDGRDVVMRVCAHTPVRSSERRSL